MASRFWVGGAGTWDGTTTTHWSASTGGAGGASVPTSADDVFFNGSSGGGSVTNTAGGVCVCRNFDSTGFTGTLAGGSTVVMTSPTVLTLGATLLANNWGFSATVAAGATLAITSNGKTMANLTVSGTATSVISLADAVNVISTGTLTHTNGTFQTNDNSVSAGTFSSSNSNTRTLTLGTTTMTLTAAGASFTMATSTNGTVSGASSTIIQSGGSSQFLVGQTSGTGTGCNFGAVQQTGGGTTTVTVAAGVTIVSYTRTGTPAKTDGVQFGANFTVSGTFTVNGNSATNRVLVQSNTVGTPRTITSATNSISNADFMDITGAGAASWNLAAITGLSGDAGGNSGITFTTSATQTFVNATGGVWDNVANWTSRVPLPQDDVVVGGTVTGTVTATMPRLGRSLDFTGFSGVFNNTLAVTLYGSLTFVAAMSYTQGGSITYGGRGTHTVTTAGKLMASTTVAAPGGSYTQQDAYSTVTTLSFNHNNGTWDTGNQPLNVGTTLSSASSNTRTLTLGTSTVTVAITSTATAWNFASVVGLTFSGASSTIVIGGALTSSRSFIGGGKTYGIITYTVANSPGALVITGANAIGTLNIGDGRHVTFPSSTTTTVSNLNVNGSNRDYVWLNHTSTTSTGNTVRTPDTAAVSLVASNIEIAAAVAPDLWVPSTNQVIVSNYDSTTFAGYELRLLTTGKFRLTYGNGVSAVNFDSVAPTSPPAKLWVKVTYEQNVAGNARITFYTSIDGVTYTILGTAQTNPAQAMTDSAQQLTIGARPDSSGPFFGKVYEVRVRNALGGADVAAFDAAAHVATSDTYTATTGEVWTLNGQAKEGDGRVIIDASTSGTTATVSTGSVISKYLTLKDSTMAGAGIKNAFRSLTVSNVSGWAVSQSRQFANIGGTFIVKPHMVQIAGVMVEKLDDLNVSGTFT